MGAAVPVEATAPTGTEREARVAIATALTGTERGARVGMVTEAVDTMLGLTVEAKAMERLWLESLARASRGVSGECPPPTNRVSNFGKARRMSYPLRRALRTRPRWAQRTAAATAPH